MTSPGESPPSIRDPGAVRDIPLLVISFDQYDDLWQPFFAMFWQNWPDCPFRVYLGTNFRIYDDPRVTSIPTGPEVNWATRVKRLLEHLDSEYVLIILDDFLIYRKVATERVLGLARTAVENRVACLRLSPGPPPTSAVDGVAGVGRIDPADPYRVTSQIAFWRSETLASLLKPTYSIWDFEFEGSLESRDFSEPFWSVTEPAIHYQHCVERGMWLPWGIRTCRQAGVAIDLETRPRMSGRALLRRYYSVTRAAVSRMLPIALQRRRWLRIVEKTRGRRLQARVARTAAAS